MMENLLDEKAVGKILGISLAGLRRWRLERRGPRFLKLGSAVRYKPEDLQSWVDSCAADGNLRQTERAA